MISSGGGKASGRVRSPIGETTLVVFPGTSWPDAGEIARAAAAAKAGRAVLDYANWMQAGAGVDV